MVDLNRLFVEPTKADVDEFTKAGEGPQIEFKGNIETIMDLAKLLSAFANSQGGVILVGVRENPVRVTGTNYQRLSKMLTEVANRIRPMPEIRAHRVAYDGKDVGVIVVKPQSGGPVVSDAGAYVRIAGSSRPMNLEQIEARLSAAPDPITNNHLAASLVALTEMVAGIQGQLDFAHSFRGQWKGYLIGFVLGTVASIVAAFVFLGMMGK
jgi:hypothetical protein